MRHSPAPWRVEWSKHTDWSDGKVHCGGILDAHGHEIVTTDTGVYGPDEADARLIAAAPELLEAVRYLMESAEPPTDADEKRIRAIIAKATGEGT